MAFDFINMKNSMSDSIKALQKNLSGLRSGRASPSLIEPIMVDAYGGKTPLGQLGNVGVPQARTLTVQLWDSSLIKAAEKAIRDSGMGLNPSVDGNTVYINVPELTQERRQEMLKKAREYGEKARISIRSTRQDVQKEIAENEKSGLCSEDQAFADQKELQKITDVFTKKVDELLSSREKEITEV